MKSGNGNLRPSIYLGFTHFITSAVVISLQWESITRRLSTEFWPILVGYGFISVVLVAISSMLWSRKQRILLAAAVPYLAASLAYAAVLYFWAANRPLSYSGADITGFFAVTLFFPYLAIWGPLISISNVLLVWLMSRSKTGRVLR